MTPPFPSPPSSDPISNIFWTTLISPTAVRSIEQSNFSAIFSKASEVDKLVTKDSLVFLFWIYPSTAKTNVYSSPRASPFSLTTANRSASGSTAKPTSATLSKTDFLKSFKCSGSGSVPRLNSPFPSQ